MEDNSEFKIVHAKYMSAQRYLFYVNFMQLLLSDVSLTHLAHGFSDLESYYSHILAMFTLQYNALVSIY
jgi:hypothetical protein